MIIECGDANKKGNVKLFYLGGCKKELDTEKAYRCVGCGGWFHPNCIKEHFKLEKKHDYGREQLRQDILKKLPKRINMKHAIKCHSDAGAGHTIGHNYLLKKIRDIIKNT